MNSAFLMRLARVACAVALVASCAGCMNVLRIGRADHNASVRSDGDAYVIIGVSPDKAAISIMPGEIEDGQFRQDTEALSATFFDFPEDGYVVTRVTPGKAYAITHVRIYKTADESFVMPFVPCRSVKTVAFKLPPARAVYITDVHYDPLTNGVRPEYGHDFERAKAFGTTHYPNLASHLSDGEMQLLPVRNSRCIGE